MKPALFSAQPIEKVLTMFMESRTKEIQNIKQKKKKLLNNCQSIKKDNSAN